MLNVGRHPRAGPEIVCAVYIDPGVNLFERFEHARAVDHQIANDRELRHRFDLDGLLDLIHKRGTALPYSAVDDHRAGAADFFKAVRLPDDRSRRFAVSRNRILLNIHQAGEQVFTLAMRHLELFPSRACVGTILPFDL